MSRTLILALIALGVFASAGCDRIAPKPSSESSASTSAQAQSQAQSPAQSPAAIVRQLYAPYLADPHAESTSGHDKGATELILPFASRSFRAAIEKDDACMKAAQAICNLDWNIIVNGQDWNISQFELKGDGETVDAYLNNAPLPIRYHFIKEDGAWKIDDVENSEPNADGKGDHLVSIKAVLNR